MITTAGPMRFIVRPLISRICPITAGDGRKPGSFAASRLWGGLLKEGFPLREFLCKGLFGVLLQSPYFGEGLLSPISQFFFFFSLCQCDTPCPTEKPAAPSSCPPKRTACPLLLLYTHEQQYCGRVTPSTRPPRISSC